MKGDDLREVIEKNVDRYKGELDKEAIDFVANSMSVVNFIKSHDENGLNAILFHREADDKYFLAVDGMHTKEVPELFLDGAIVSQYPTNFRDQDAS